MGTEQAVRKYGCRRSLRAARQFFNRALRLPVASANLCDLRRATDQARSRRGPCGPAQPTSSTGLPSQQAPQLQPPSVLHRTGRPAAHRWRLEGPWQLQLGRSTRLSQVYNSCILYSLTAGGRQMALDKEDSDGNH